MAKVKHIVGDKRTAKRKAPMKKRPAAPAAKRKALVLKSIAKGAGLDGLTPAEAGKVFAAYMAKALATELTVAAQEQDAGKFARFTNEEFQRQVCDVSERNPVISAIHDNQSRAKPVDAEDKGISARMIEISESTLTALCEACSVADAVLCRITDCPVPAPEKPEFSRGELPGVFDRMEEINSKAYRLAAVLRGIAAQL